MRRQIVSVVSTAAVLMAAAASQAALTGSATVSGSPLGGGLYRYTVTLSNTGTTTIGTLWFAWIPGENFMTAVPTNLASPAGWSGQVFGGAGSVSILWQANNAGANLASGGSLSTFAFTSSHTPAELSGLSVNDARYAVTTSYVYSGSAFSDAGYMFVANVVPVPSSSAFAALSLASLAASRRHRPS